MNRNNNPDYQPSRLAGVPDPVNMNDFDDEQAAMDLDGADVPRGNDPLIRYDRGREWFNHGGLWYQTGNLPPDVRRAYLIEQMRRDREERNLI